MERTEEQLQALRETLEQLTPQQRTEAVDRLLSAAPHLEGHEIVEYLACYLNYEYFIRYYVRIYDSVSRGWVAFDLWPAQRRVAQTIHNNNKVVILKARQVGVSWLSLAYILWLMLFRAPSSCLIMSKRDDDAVYLLGKERLKGMYARLPDFMKAERVERDDAHVFALSRGTDMSVARAMSTSSGDGYTGTFAFIDEADLLPDLGRVLLSIEPTVNAGGKLLLVSKADRSRPTSMFKEMYRAGRATESEWASDFIAWYEHPLRDQEWYTKQVRDALAIEGTLDSVYESYPATDTEALSSRSLDKRFPATWLLQCYVEGKPQPLDFGVPLFKELGKELTLYEHVERNRSYAIGVDSAAGLPEGDYSVTQVVEKWTGNQVAVYVGKSAPDLHATITKALSAYYNDAVVLVERNNHGGTFIRAAQQLRVPLVQGMDGRVGWYQTGPSKVHLYDELAPLLRDGAILIADLETQLELGQLERETLNAPRKSGLHDDRAVAFALAQYARRYASGASSDMVSFNPREWDD